MPPQRSNLKTMHHAGELRRELTPAEGHLWAYLRGHRLNGIGFRRHTVLAAGARGTPSATTLRQAQGPPGETCRPATSNPGSDVRLRRQGSAQATPHLRWVQV